MSELVEELDRQRLPSGEFALLRPERKDVAIDLPLKRKDNTEHTALMQLLTEQLALIQHIRCTLDRIDTALERGTADRESSIAIEDRASGDKVSITTKEYPSDPLGQVDVDHALDAHGYARRTAVELAMRGWEMTVEQLRAENS